MSRPRFSVNWLRLARRFAQLDTAQKSLVLVTRFKNMGEKPRVGLACSFASMGRMFPPKAGESSS